MTCSTCDGYELVPGARGLLETCPDCRERCPAHRSPVVAGQCEVCVREASLAVVLIERAREARASLLFERSIA